eukprot:12696491-Alexandrium_andersonii.AAC.1
MSCGFGDCCSPSMPLLDAAPEPETGDGLDAAAEGVPGVGGEGEYSTGAGCAFAAFALACALALALGAGAGQSLVKFAGSWAMKASPPKPSNISELKPSKPWRSWSRILPSCS